jgi:hypothetical protein
MTPAELAARYRVYAAKCLMVARRQESGREKLALIDLARAWADLADLTEKHKTLFGALARLKAG